MLEVNYKILAYTKKKVKNILTTKLVNANIILTNTNKIFVSN